MYWGAFEGILQPLEGVLEVFKGVLKVFEGVLEVCWKRSKVYRREYFVVCAQLHTYAPTTSELHTT